MAGGLYERSVALLVAATVAVQAVALAVQVTALRRARAARPAVGDAGPRP